MLCSSVLPALKLGLHHLYFNYNNNIFLQLAFSSQNHFSLSVSYLSIQPYFTYDILLGSTPNNHSRKKIYEKFTKYLYISTICKKIYRLLYYRENITFSH